jgi:hypothetical protein
MNASTTYSANKYLLFMRLRASFRLFTNDKVVSANEARVCIQYFFSSFSFQGETASREQSAHARHLCFINFSAKLVQIGAETLDWEALSKLIPICNNKERKNQKLSQRRMNEVFSQHVQLRSFTSLLAIHHLNMQEEHE